MLVDGQQIVVGGTSAVAPLWAALICRMVQVTGVSFGLIQESLYAGIQRGAHPVSAIVASLPAKSVAFCRNIAAGYNTRSKATT